MRLIVASLFQTSDLVPDSFGAELKLAPVLCCCVLVWHRDSVSERLGFCILESERGSHCMHLLLVQSSDWGGKCRDLPPAAAAPGEAAQAPPDVRYRRGPRGDHSQPLRRAGTGRRRRSQGMDQCGAGHVPSPVRSADARQCTQPVRPSVGSPRPPPLALPVSHRRLGTRVKKTDRNRSGNRGYRSNRFEPVPVGFKPT